MRTRDTLLGAVVLGLVLAGVFWARAPRPGSGPATPAESWPADPDRSIPDITTADGVVDLGDVRVVLSVAPRPPMAFGRLRFRVQASAGGTLLPMEEGGRISFEMTMPMGDHRYTLIPGPDGWQEAEVVLPMCPSGNPRWYAIVEATVAGQSVTARFQVDLAKPGGRPSG